MNVAKGFRIAKFVVLGIAIVALVSLVIMLLWNWLVPGLFNGPAINYWQSLGILLLSKILFSGIGHKHQHDDSKHNYWRKRFMEKLSPEQKEKIKEKFNERFDEHFGEE